MSNFLVSSIDDSDKNGLYYIKFFAITVLSFLYIGLFICYKYFHSYRFLFIFSSSFSLFLILFGGLNLCGDGRVSEGEKRRKPCPFKR